MDEATKIQGKTAKIHNKAFDILVNAVCKKIRAFKLPKKERLALIDDLLLCNNIELMHVLSVDEFKTKKQYIETIWAFLVFEYVTYDYHPDKRLQYPLYGLKEITEGITEKHRYIDLRKKMFKQ